MNIPDNYGSGSQPNDLISTTRLIPPLPDIEGKNDAWSWSHIYPQYSIMLMRLNTQLKDEQGRPILKQVYLHDQEYNTKVLGYNIQVVNSILANEFIKHIEAHRDMGAHIDYTKHVSTGLKLINEWRVGGIIATPPAQTVDTNYITRERYIVTHVRGHQFCENVWGPSIYGGDFAFIVGKMHPFDARQSVANQLIYKIGNGKQINVTLPSSDNQIHYIPQFVAVSYKQATLPFKDLCFEVHDAPRDMSVVEIGIPKLIGRCDQNIDFYEQHLVPIKRGRFIQTEDSADDILTHTIDSGAIMNMQEVTSRSTIYMNYMISL